MALATCRATADERRRSLPADRMVPDPLFSSTYAITIDAPPEQVWPWIAQMGAGRAGWYSWDAIDNGGTTSATRVVPELQTIASGDVMPAAPGATAAFVVAKVDAPRDLILTAPDGCGGYAVAWEHLLEPLEGRRTRLISRARASSRWVDLARTKPPTGRRRIFLERVYAALARLPRPLLIGVAAAGHRIMEARHLRGIQRRSTVPANDPVRLERFRRPLLTCGILAGVLYVAMTLLIGRLWDGYSTADQTISELSAIGAPTRPLWMALGAVYDALMMAFGWTAWKSAPNRALRIAGALLFTQAVFGIFWPPMHQRAVLAISGGTLTDTLHIVWTIVTSLFFVVALGCGAAGFGKRFRIYSLATMAVVLASGAWTGTYAPAIQANLPTPWAGVWERINTNVFMLWVVVLSAAILRSGTPQARERRAGAMPPRVWRNALLACGAVGSLTYVATDILASLRYAGYSVTDQAVSELFAIGAPTSRIVVPLFTLSSTLLAAFAVGVWASFGQSRAFRWLAIMMFANAINSLVLWNLFPMHMRGTPLTMTDAMHGILAINPFVLLTIAFGIVAFKSRFRAYSAATALIVVVPAVLSFSSIAAFAANQPTPGMGLAERVSQYGYQLWQAMLALVLLLKGQTTKSNASRFKTPEGEARFLAAYDGELKRWPVSYEPMDVPTRFGMTHVVACGPLTAPPLVLLHGYMATSTMWWPNIAAFSKEFRVYAVDVMGQPSRSRPAEPICNAADFVSWLTATLDALRLDRVYLLGMSFGGWLALNYAVAAPERIRKLVLLSPGGLLPMVSQFSMRGMVMVWFPTRLVVNSFFHWLGFTDRAYANLLEMIYLGLRHFRMPIETARVMPAVVSDEALRSVTVPTLLLIGNHEVISDAARALERARRLIPKFEGELVSACRHDMVSSRHDIVDARVLEFLTQARTGDPAVAARTVA